MAVTAALDTSDGTAADVLHLAEGSAVGVLLYERSLPLPPGLAAAAAAAGCDPFAWALGGGEDYELAFTAAPAFARAAPRLARTAGARLTRIGDVVHPRAGRWVVGPQGEPRRLLANGWDHLAPPR